MMTRYLHIYQRLAQKKTHKAVLCGFESGDTWIRTRDTRIFSPMLYQLSYITLVDKLVKRVVIPGFEPGTHGFSVRCSTN